jgi:phage terminase large subunit-like protein
MPPGTKWRAQPPAFILPNGSEIHIKSADPSSGFEKFQGAGLTAAWFDEEPVGENGRQVFHEVYARRAPGIPLKIWMTFTPLQGFSWSHKELWDKETRCFPDVETFTVTQLDASKSHGGFWSEKELTDFQAGYSEAEWEARVMGKFGLLSGSCYFNGKLIEETRERIKGETSERYSIKHAAMSGPILSKDSNGHLTVYRPPAPGHAYILGVDCAGGIGRDFSCAWVLDRKDLACAAKWKSNQVDANLFASDGVLPLGKYYNNAQIVVESNNDHGGTVIQELRTRYHNLYRQRKWNAVRRTYDDSYGWRTLSSNRMAIYDAIAKALREGEWVPNRDLLVEMGTVVKLDDDRKVDHLDGYHDDEVIAAGLALAVHYDSPMYQIDHRKYRLNIPNTETGWMVA